MSRNDELPQTPDAVAAFMDRLSFEPAPTPHDEAALLESLPPAGSAVMVVRSLRLPLELDQAVAAAAKAAEIPKTTWIRQAISMACRIQVVLGISAAFAAAATAWSSSSGRQIGRAHV